MIYRQLIGVCVLTCVAGFSSAWADAVGELSNFLDTMKTFQASFEQSQLDDTGGVKQASEGTVYLAKPGRFRWDYESPYEQQIIANGSRVWFYDIDLDQVTIKTIDAAMGATPALLLSGELHVQEDFDLTNDSVEGDIAWVSLQPKNRAEKSSARQLKVGVRDGVLAAMDLVDNFGQHTVIQFSNITLNQQLDAETFDFVAPPGVDVFEE